MNKSPGELEWTEVIRYHVFKLKNKCQDWSDVLQSTLNKSMTFCKMYGGSFWESPCCLIIPCNDQLDQLLLMCLVLEIWFDLYHIRSETINWSRQLTMNMRTEKPYQLTDHVYRLNTDSMWSKQPWGIKGHIIYLINQQKTLPNLSILFPTFPDSSQLFQTLPNYSRLGHHTDGAQNSTAVAALQ